MKLRSLIIAASILTVLTTAAQAQEAALKIGVVNIQKVFKDYQGVIDMQEKLEEDLRPDKEEIEALLDKTDKLIQDMRNDRLIEPGSYSWFVKDQEIKRNQFQLKEMRSDFNDLIDKRRVEVFKAFYSDFCTAIEQYAKNNNYDLILSVTDKELKGETSFDILNEITLKALHYYTPTLDRTNQIVQVMNRMYEQRQ